MEETKRISLDTLAENSVIDLDGIPTLIYKVVPNYPALVQRDGNKIKVMRKKEYGNIFGESYLLLNKTTGTFSPHTYYSTNEYWNDKQLTYISSEYKRLDKLLKEHGL
ncbi:MAG: hypothetical protein AABY14_03345 [Nanoarchaeota archaeon]